MDDCLAISARRLTLMLPMSRRRQRRGQDFSDLPVGGALRISRKRRLLVTALNDVSFTVRRGERLGLIGHNGAGKSSLLRVLAGIYLPTRGTCEVRGSVGTLFSNSIGMKPAISGYRNIFLVGYLHGLSKREINAIVPDIVEFSELGEYLHMPMEKYSTGMSTRIGFAVATAVRPEVLLIDEVFGTGDRRFQHKARERISRMVDSVSTLVMASHSPTLIRQFCDTGLWLEHGQVRAHGPVEEVLERYEADAALHSPEAAEDVEVVDADLEPDVAL